jgi:aryl sulfotransferase
MTRPRLIQAPSRNVRSRLFDSSRWSGYEPRPDDIIISTYPKCGTTWMQRIVGMLVFKSTAPRAVWESSPWFDIRVQGPIEAALATAEAQAHRRFFKTHLPLDALPIYEGVKFIHVARDGRDAALSLHNHLLNFTPHAITRLNEINRNDLKFGDDFPAIPQSAAEFFFDWISDGGALGDEGVSFFHI